MYELQTREGGHPPTWTGNPPDGGDPRGNPSSPERVVQHIWTSTVQHGALHGEHGERATQLMVLPPPTAAGAAQITISVFLRAKHSIAGAPPTSDLRVPTARRRVVATRAGQKRAES